MTYIRFEKLKIGNCVCWLSHDKEQNIYKWEIVSPSYIGSSRTFERPDGSTKAYLDLKAYIRQHKIEHLEVGQEAEVIEQIIPDHTPRPKGKPLVLKLPKPEQGSLF